MIFDLRNEYPHLDATYAEAVVPCKVAIVFQQYRRAERALEKRRSRNGDTVSLRCLSSRPVILEGVSVRVSPQFATFAHIDLDEANGCGHKKGDLGMIVHG